MGLSFGIFAYVRKIARSSGRKNTPLSTLAFIRYLHLWRLRGPTRPRDFRKVSMERQSNRRRRPALSCLECRRRKIKCDRKDPCTHCITTQAQCVYKVYRNEASAQQQQQQPQQVPSWDSRSSPSVYAPSPSVQAQQISVNRPIADFPLGSRVVAAAERQSQASNAFDRNDIGPTVRAHNAEPESQDLLQRIQVSEDSSRHNLIHELSESNRDILARQTGLQDSQTVLNKTRILRWSHWIGTAQEV